MNKKNMQKALSENLSLKERIKSYKRYGSLKFGSKTKKKI